MIIKFDGVDGCGKSTLSTAVAESLIGKGYRVAVASEFASPTLLESKSAEATPIPTLQIREAVLDPAFNCDDVERQLLLHFLSRRRNRVELPFLNAHNDYVVVDRSTLSNYAYAAALSRRLTSLSDIAVGDIETADLIFWIDTPVSLCAERLSARARDAVEKKGVAYFEKVRGQFQQYATENDTTRTLDGRSKIEALVGEVLLEIEGRKSNA
ncbi:MAG: thymidylate kinase [Roseitalea sp.]|nr:thymidylate kinase [Roseitalea sp.]MBO6689930.1 thymidylate kinase [Henriciella sp.]MBO6953794.1 thymidylate kinase [Rhizobiaceae bacterium]MBO6613932.1 thymidylate kinase [Roseitalea sp.]MBO6673379.1 thymidylate kinase [Roseitalea sp.]